MPGQFTAALVLLVLGTLLNLGSRFLDVEKADDKQFVSRWKRGLRYVSYGFVTLAILFTLASAYNPVSTKNEGIETTFGATSGHLGNGLHFTWPWVKVHEMDAAIQTDSFTGPQCIQVRIANQQTGCAAITIQWRVVPSAVDGLYQNFRSFEHVREALVTRKLTAAVNTQLAGYNPLDAISQYAAVTGKGAASAPRLTEVADRIKTQMQDEIGSQIEVLSVILPLLTFDNATQDRINQLQQQYALTRIAIQTQETNRQQAIANTKLAKSVNTSPNVLVAQCLSILEEMVKQAQPVPAGFSCWPGKGVAAVIAGAK